MSPTPMSAALYYAQEKRWAVFPLHSISAGACTCGHADCSNPGKHPRTTHGLKDATTDPEQIRKWWGEHPEANIGIATGSRSRLAVVDVDDPAQFEPFTKEHGELPHTLIARTGKGVHLYYASSNGAVRTKARIFEGIDVRGEGGYVVAPPSLHVNGRRYSWEHDDPNATDLAPWPGKLLALMEKPKPSRPPVEVPAPSYKEGGTPYGLKAMAEETATLKAARQGERNETLNQVAFNLYQLVAGNQLDDAHVTSELTFCARGIGLEDREIEGTLRSARSAGTASPRVPPEPVSLSIPSRTSAQVHTPPEEAPLSTPPRDTASLHTPPKIACEKDILAAFVRALRVCNVVGEDRNAKVVYLAMTSRLLSDPVSVVVKGPSSSGKSHTVQTTRKFFPEGAVYELTAMSERALVFSEEDYAHRSIVLYEAVALREVREKSDSNLTAYFVRSLISEGRIVYPVTVRGKDGGYVTRKIEKRGPTNLIITTTAPHLHGENETLLLSLPTNDTSEQTRAVLVELAGDGPGLVDLTEWHELQDWLASAEHRVVIPYARYLAENIPPVAIRLRRDFKAILCLIKAHAILHQLSRDKDAEGRIVATEHDYLVVRELVADLVAEGVEATVSATMRETVECVEKLAQEEGVTARAVGETLGLDRSTVSRRLAAARGRGYLTNLEDRRGRPARYVLGDPMPQDVVLLPHTCTPLGDESAGQEGVCSDARSHEGIYRGGP